MLILFVYTVLYVPTNVVSTSLRLDDMLDRNKIVTKKHNGPWTTKITRPKWPSLTENDENAAQNQRNIEKSENFKTGKSVRKRNERKSTQRHLMLKPKSNIAVTVKHYSSQVEPQIPENFWVKDPFDLVYNSNGNRNNDYQLLFYVNKKKTKSRHLPLRRSGLNEEKKIISVAETTAHNEYSNIIKRLLKNEEKYEDDHRFPSLAKQTVKCEDPKTNVGIIQRRQDHPIPIMLRAKKDDSTTKEDSKESSDTNLSKESSEIDSDAENIQENSTASPKKSREKESKREDTHNSMTDSSNESGIDSDGENIQESTTDLPKQSSEIVAAAEDAQIRILRNDGASRTTTDNDLTSVTLPTIPTANEYLLNGPRFVRDDNKIEKFTNQVLSESINMLNNMESETDIPWLKKEIRKILSHYQYEFSAFAKETKSHKIMTSLGTQRVILNTLDTSVNTLKDKIHKLIDLIETKREKGSFKENQGLTTNLELKIDQLEDSHYKYACTLGICRSKDGFTNFLIHILTDILKSNDRKLRQATDTALELLSNTDLSPTADNATKSKIKGFIKSAENLPIKSLRRGITTLKDILVHRNQPRVVSTREDDKANDANLVVVLEFMDKLEQAIEGINGSKEVLEKTRQALTDWAADRGHSDDIKNIAMTLQKFIMQAMIKINEKYREAFLGKMNEMSSHMKKKIKEEKS